MAPPLALRIAVSIGCLIVGAATVPRVAIGRDADGWLDDDRDTQRALADAVAEYVLAGVDAGAFHTGSMRFDGEWALGTHQMAALGLAQVVHVHPELRGRYLPAIVAAADVLADAHTYRFGEAAWGEDPLAALDGPHGHAYLGYVALALGSLRELDPDTRHAALHDHIALALTRRLEASDRGVVETYPDEAYPCDIASIVGAIAQHARIVGIDRSALVERMAASFRTRWIDPASGYLVQAITPSALPRDAPRGSGTALAAYFWSFADRGLADQLDGALLGPGRADLLGFAGIIEHAPGHAVRGDIDSGPVVWGVSVSATGFALSAARRQGDREAFAALFRTAALFGVPVTDAGRTRFLAGGPLGNAILLAMMTARRA